MTATMTPAMTSKSALCFLLAALAIFIAVVFWAYAPIPPDDDDDEDDGRDLPLTGAPLGGDGLAFPALWNDRPCCPEGELTGVR